MRRSAATSRGSSIMPASRTAGLRWSDQTIWVRAARNIRKGEELTYDYNTEGDKVIRAGAGQGVRRNYEMAGRGPDVA